MVPQGGTGVSNLPQGGVLIGQGADAINVVVGSEGEVLTFVSGTWVGAQPTGGSGGLSTVNVSGNIEGDGSSGAPVTLKSNISLTSVTASFSGSGAGLTNIPNSALQNSSILINGETVQLGGYINITTAQGGGGFSSDGVSKIFTGTGLSAGQVVALSGSLVAADKSNNLKSNAIGVVDSVSGTDVTVKLVGEITTNGASSIAAIGTPVYVGSNGSVVAYSSLVAGDYATQVGFISDAGKIILQPRIFGQL